MFKKILLPVDIQEPDVGAKALDIAVNYAKSFDASIHVLTVVPAYNMPMVASFFPKDAMEKSIRQAESTLQEYAATNIPADVERSTAIRQGRPYEEIVEEVDKSGCDVVIMPSHNRAGLHGVLLGSCADNVAEHAHCSVLIVR